MTKFSAAQQSQLAQIGAFLRENREKQGKSLQDIAINTYIRPQLLNGIETGNPDMLPEPIFVQGFIRRYAENLGLKGIELAQQFTVNSIPSTPRPAPRSLEAESSSTTRIISSAARQTTGQASASTALFSSGNASPAGGTLPSTPQKTEPVAPPPNPPAKSPAAKPVVSGGLESSSADMIFQMDDQAIAPPSLIDTPLPDTLPTPDSLPVEPNTLIDALPEHATALQTDDLELPNPDLPTPDLPGLDLSGLASSASEASALETPDLEMPAPETVGLESLTPEPPNLERPSIETPQFEDDLPAAFTTQVTSADPGLAPRTAYAAADPVGVEIGQPEGPNLKPFAIGAIVLAGLTAGVVLLVNMFGGESSPTVADAPEPAPVAEEVVPAAVEPPPAPAPVSTAPVYVETEATAETYVSVSVDGTIVFEDIMQPGDTQLWEGQEVIDVYSGNAGGLTIAANGGSAEVLGESGQLGQKIFEAQ